MFEIKDLEINNKTNETYGKTNKEIKQKIGESFVNEETCIADIKENVRMFEKAKDAGNVIQKCQTIIRSNRKNIIWLAYHQGVIVRLNQRETFASIVTRFGVGRSTTTFKISVVKFIEVSYEN